MGLFSKGEKITLGVKGMSCEHCVKAVTAAAKSVAGVKKVKVDLAGGTAALDYDGKAETVAAVKSAIAEQGFEAA